LSSKFSPNTQALIYAHITETIRNSLFSLEKVDYARFGISGGKAGIALPDDEDEDATA
jgi:hypothetical protein